jgi:hypothetical protein
MSDRATLNVVADLLDVLYRAKVWPGVSRDLVCVPRLLLEEATRDLARYAGEQARRKVPSSVGRPVEGEPTL